MLNFFKSHKFKIIALVVALLFGMMLYSASGDGINNIPRNLLMMITAPVQSAGAYIADVTGDFFDRFVNYKKTIEENEFLRQENAELNQKLIDYEKIKDENEQFKAGDEIRQAYGNIETTAAFVISRDPEDSYGTFMVDKGSLHGVAVYDPVMTMNGLVGIVIKVGPISSMVRTIYSPDNEVGAIEIYSKELGMLRSDTTLAAEGRVKFEILSEDSTIKEGDMIITAGANGIYPYGIPIGTVESVTTESHGVTKLAIVIPTEDINKVTTVQIVTDFLGQGSKLIDYLGE